MPLYRYEALDRTGKPVVGAMDVADEQTLTARLGAMGYRPTTIEVAPRVVGSGRQVTSRAAAGRTAGTAAPPGASRLTASGRSKARMFHQLHIAFRAGMPAYQAITTVAGQVHEPSLRKVLGELARAVQDGGSVSHAMEPYPWLFTRGDVGVVRAGEVSGFLPEAFGALAEQHEQDDNTGRRLRVWVWFFHSNVLVLLLFPPVAFFLKEAIPALSAAPGFAAAGRAFLTISLPLLLAYFGLIAYGIRARRNPGFCYRWHRFLLKVPMVGRINYLRANAVFARTLQQVYHAGIPAASAWETAAGAVPNRYLSEAFAAGQPVVAGTGRFSTALQQVNLMEPADIGMVATGESSGEIPQALNYLANRYEEETRVALGSMVVRGATLFVTWAFLLGGLGMLLLSWGYTQGLLRLMSAGE